jgi:sensor domain CHASE-containing protein
MNNRRITKIMSIVLALMTLAMMGTSYAQSLTPLSAKDRVQAIQNALNARNVAGRRGWNTSTTVDDVAKVVDDTVNEAQGRIFDRGLIDARARAQLARTMF